MNRSAPAFIVLVLLPACSSPPPVEKAPPPAKVANPVKEADFSSVTLTPEAESRLAIQTAPVEEREVQRVRVVGGEVVAPPGRAVTVAAPIAGTVLATGERSRARAGHARDTRSGGPAPAAPPQRGGPGRGAGAAGDGAHAGAPCGAAARGGGQEREGRRGRARRAGRRGERGPGSRSHGGRRGGRRARAGEPGRRHARRPPCRARPVGGGGDAAVRRRAPGRALGARPRLRGRRGPRGREAGGRRPVARGSPGNAGTNGTAGPRPPDRRPHGRDERPLLRGAPTATPRCVRASGWRSSCPSASRRRPVSSPGPPCSTTSTAAPGCTRRRRRTSSSAAGCRCDESRATWPSSPAGRARAPRSCRRGRGAVRHRVRERQMMCWLVRTSLRQRVLVVALAAVLVVVGVRTVRRRAWDVFPEFAPPLVEIQTEAPGLVDRGGREPRHRPPRERAQRHLLARDDPLEVGARAVVGRPDLRGRHRPDARPASWCRSGSPRVAGRLPAVARAAGHPAAAVVDQPRAEDRRLRRRRSRRWS